VGESRAQSEAKRGCVPKRGVILPQPSIFLKLLHDSNMLDSDQYPFLGVSLLDERINMEKPWPRPGRG
jgi:hypothetical protein